MATKKTKALGNKVIQRALGENYDSFLQQYNEARLVTRGVAEPSANDKAIVRVLQKEKSYRKTAEKLGITLFKVMAASGRVSAWQE